MTNALTKIVGRKKIQTKKSAPAAAVSSAPIELTTKIITTLTPTPITPNPWTCAPFPPDLCPCPTCGSAIRWLNAAGVARCLVCQPPKFASLVRSRQILCLRGQIGQPGERRRWERVIELPGGCLASESGIPELIAMGVLPPSTKAQGGVGINGGRGGAAGGERENFTDDYDRFVEIDPDEYFSAASTSKTRQ